MKISLSNFQYWLFFLLTSNKQELIPPKTTSSFYFREGRVVAGIV